MTLRGALAMVVVLMLVVCSAGGAGCVARCAVGTAGVGVGSCHADAMPGMVMDGGSVHRPVSVATSPAGCAGHAVAVVEANASVELSASLPTVVRMMDSPRDIGGAGVALRMVRDVGSSGRLRIPLRV